tara:strand:+ start:1257 stop:1772 length:516 start_codon:yes stop_codon:yes gene_type:complete
MSWFNLLKAPTDDLVEWKKDRQAYMLQDKVWREAGGNHTKNAYMPTKQPIPADWREGANSKTGFRFAKIEEIEEILDRKMTVDDFAFAPINWKKQEGVVFDRIGKEGQVELAKRYLIQQKDQAFPIENNGIMYDNLEQWSTSRTIRDAIRLIGRPSIGLKLMGYKGQGRWE